MWKNVVVKLTFRGVSSHLAKQSRDPHFSVLSVCHSHAWLYYKLNLHVLWLFIMHKRSDVLQVPVNVLRHTREDEGQKYKTFNETQESWAMFRIVAALFSIYYVLSTVKRTLYILEVDSDEAPFLFNYNVAYIVFEAALIILVWVLVWLKRKQTGNTLNARKVAVVSEVSNTSAIMYLQNTVIIFVTILLGFWLLIRVAQGQCEERASPLNFTCNPNHESYGIPVDSMIVIMLIPLTFCVVLRGTPFSVHLLTWALTLGFLLSTAAYVRIDQNLPFFAIYAPTSLILLYESERQNKVIFLVTEKLSFLLQENERLADETHANELRHMVGNVAHDLRTVRTANLCLPFPYCEWTLDLSNEYFEYFV